MALIRAEYAIDYRDKTTTLNLADVAHDASRIKEEAEAEAVRIVQAAQEERERLLADAAEEGHKLGYEAGHLEGLQLGQAEGKQHAEDNWSHKIQALAVAWGDALTTLEQRRRAIVHNLEVDALRLVADIATRVTRRAVEFEHSDITLRALNDAITRIDHATRVTVQVNPEDLEATEGGMQAVAEQLLGSPDLRLKPNDEIAPGSVIVESDAARIDATIDGALEGLTAALLPDDETLMDRLDTASHIEASDGPPLRDAEAPAAPEATTESDTEPNPGAPTETGAGDADTPAEPEA